MVTHTDDCLDCDFRLSRVPAGSWPEGSMRPVLGPRFDYPKYIGGDRSPDFDEQLVQRGEDLFPWKQAPPVAEIPQVRQTYSYLDGNYGVLNQHQLAIGESTCFAKLINRPAFDGGRAWFDVSELSRLAMERCKTARCAVKLMGGLAEKHGYFGAGWEGESAVMEAGESLTVADPNEVWIFHVMPDGTDASAVWVAQRVPDDHISVVSNHFSIGPVEPGSPDFLYSRNLWQVAIDHGFWAPPEKEKEEEQKDRHHRRRKHREEREADDDGEDDAFRYVPPFDVSDFSFKKVYTAPAPPAYKPYFARRTWRVFDLAAPSLRLSPDLGPDSYPFSVRVERKLSASDIMAMNRDYFQDTPFDLTKGLAAGPWGNPNRYDRDSMGGAISDDQLQRGFFERPVSLFRTSYSFVTQSRAWLPDSIGGRVWWGPHAPHSTCYVPFYAASDLPAPIEFSQGSLYRFGEPTRPDFCDADVVVTGSGGGGEKKENNSSAKQEVPRRADCRLSEEQRSDALWSRLWTAHDAGRNPNPAAQQEQKPRGYNQVADSNNHGSMFWSSLLLSNWAERFWNRIMPDIQKEQRRLEKFSLEVSEQWEKEALAILEQQRSEVRIQESEKAAAKDGKREHAAVSVELFVPEEQDLVSRYLHRKSTRHAKQVAEYWWSLFGRLAVKFRDGYQVDNLRMDLYAPTKIFYPVWWLELVGFWADREWMPTVFNRTHGLPQNHPGAADIAPQVFTAAEIKQQQEKVTSGLSLSVFSVLLVALAFLAGRLTSRYSPWRRRRSGDYTQLRDGIEP